jgi:hypothetical protein
MKQATMVECGGEARVGQRANVVGGKRRSATVEGAGATPKLAQSKGLSRHAAVGSKRRMAVEVAPTVGHLRGRSHVSAAGRRVRVRSLPRW